jgi:hypothetical protein
MQQPWPPQSRKGFWEILPRIYFTKFLFLKKNLLIGDMIAQIYLKIIIQKIETTTPFCKQIFCEYGTYEPQPAPPNSGGPKEKRKLRGHITSGHGNGIDETNFG